MGNFKRYVGIRLYLPDSESEVKEGGETGVDVKPAALGVGGLRISVKARREHHQDSRLAILRGSSSGYLLILSKMAGISISAATVAAVGGSWKGYAVGAMIFFIGSAFVFKDMALAWLKRYWR